MANIRKVLDLSTAHMPEGMLEGRACGCDRAKGSPDGVVVYALDYGWLMWVPDSPEDSAGGSAEPPPAEILAVQKYARGLGCDYVLFDADADEDPNLPTWEW